MADAALDTKERILDAAERLFVRRGFEGSSLRAVTAAASVNLAAVHYHFGSKQALLTAVLARRVAPVNEERLKRLDELQGAAGGEGPVLEAILDALFRPVFERIEGNAEWRDLTMLMLHGPLEIVQSLPPELFGEVVRRFGSALVRALPHLEPEEALERFQFAIGAMIHVISGRARIAMPGLPPPKANARGGTLPQLIAFAAAGLRGPKAAP